jgi:ribosomal subunit interface protein
MDVLIKCRSGKPTDEERQYLQSKLHKLDRYLDEIGAVHIDLARAQQRGSGEVHIVQATLTADHGVIIRAEERNPDFAAAVDSLHDTLQRQIIRYKDRRYRRGKARRGTDGADRALNPAADGDSAGAQLSANGASPHVVKIKQFVYKPMDSNEAIEQMELLGHDFFVFTDAHSNQVNVVYRRNDGNYGLIEQEMT